MPLSDEQFGNLLKTLESRDLIIRIDENTKNMRVNFDEHKKEDAANNALMTQSLGKMHNRIDSVGTEIASIKNRVIGGFFVATLLASAITWGINVYNQGRMYQQAVVAIAAAQKEKNEIIIHNP